MKPLEQEVTAASKLHEVGSKLCWKNHKLTFVWSPHSDVLWHQFNS